MKRIILFYFIMCSLIIATIALAQEDNQANKKASPSPVDEEKVKALKEKLATKVAELRENQTRGFFGEIASLGKTSFTLVTPAGEIIVRFNEDTLVFTLADKKTEAKTADLKNKQTASVLGLYEEKAKQITGKVILIQSLPRYFSGEITEINKKDATFTLKTKKDETLVFDYERTTLANEYQKDNKKIAKSGLSRLIVGDLVHVWGNPTEEDQQKYRAVRLLRLPSDLFGEATTPSTSPPATPKASVKTSPKPSPTP